MTIWQSSMPLSSSKFITYLYHRWVLIDRPVELPSIQDLLQDGEDIQLSYDKDFKTFGDDQAEEEVDNSDEIDAIVAAMPDEYEDEEDDEVWAAIQAEYNSKSSDEEESDDEEEDAGVGMSEAEC